MNENTQDDRSKRKIKQRRTQILEAAVNLFAQKGFNATTTREIARAADLSEGTLYNYFKDKEGIFSALLESLVVKMKTQGMFTTTFPTDSQSFIDEIFEMQHRFLLDNQILVNAVLPEIITNDEYRSIFIHDVYLPTISFILRQLQARSVIGQIRPVNAEMTTRILIGLLYGISFLHTLEDPIIDSNWDSLLGQLVALIFEGLAPIQGSLT